VLGTNLLNWSTASLDSFFISRSFGVADLGLYNRAFVLVTNPMNAMVMSLQGVLFPSYSRAQAQKATLMKIYAASLGIIALLSLPLFCGIASVQHTVTEGLYGAQWSKAAPLLTPLALAMPLHALMGLAGPVAWAVGRVDLELKVQMIICVFAVLVLGVTSRFSLLALSWGMFSIYLLRFLMMTQAVAKLLQMSPAKIAGSLCGPLALSAVTAATVWAIDGTPGVRDWTAPYRLLTDVLAGGFATCLCFFAARHSILGNEALWLMEQLRPHLPRFLKRLIPLPA
jgi:PST family polysaccharide transporter